MLPSQDHAYGLAIRGRHSRFSKAILVNDEPLGSYLPFSWVEIHLSSPELNVAGFAVPGIPGVLVGRNDKMAWGAVHLFSQETEFNLETLALNQNRSPEDKVETEFSFHKETVLVRDKDRSYTFLVYRSSRKHIIIKPSLEDIHSRNMVSLNWTGSYPGDEILCLKLLATAGDWQSFRTAISYFNSPDLGFVFADQQGNIGANITGNFPMATTENKISTKKSQTDKDRGERFIPFEQLPALLNPGKNWVSTLDLQNDYTVNQFYKTVIPPETLLTKFQHDSSGVLMSENIEKNLALSYSPENFQLLSSWLEIIQSRKYTGNTKQMGDIVWLLRDWKGGAQESGVASLVYKIWQWFVIKNVFADQMSVGLYDMFIDIPEVYMPIFYRIMTNSTDPWFDDSGTPNIKESREEIVAKSFVETLQLLNDRLGEEIYRWQWKNFIISLNTRYDMPNNFYNFLSDNAPIQASANNIVTRLSGPGAQKLIVNEKRNQVAFVVDWNEDCCYRSINSTRFGLKLVSFPDYENAGPFSEKKFKTIFFDKDFKPLLYIYIEPK